MPLCLEYEIVQFKKNRFLILYERRTPLREVEVPSALFYFDSIRLNDIYPDEFAIDELDLDPTEVATIVLDDNYKKKWFFGNKGELEMMIGRVGDDQYRYATDIEDDEDTISEET